MTAMCHKQKCQDVSWSMVPTSQKNTEDIKMYLNFSENDDF